MALNALGSDPCSKLNNDATNGYPQFWFPDDVRDEALTYRRIAEPAGSTRSFKNVYKAISADGNKNLLKTLTANSSYRLLQFLSGGGVGASTISGVDYTKLKNVLLGTPTAPKFIIDDYVAVAGRAETSYSYSTTNSPQLTDAHIQSIIEALQTDNFLLKETDIYTETNFGTTAPTANTASLLYLYKQDQENKITSDEQTRKTLLETRNLRFFGAFLAEYCFYRTRYQFLLKTYFRVYTSWEIKAASGANESWLFSGAGTGTQIGLNQYTGASITQENMISALSYHMAIINTRMTDMRRILSAINTLYNTIFTKIQTKINDLGTYGSNKYLEDTINTLKVSAEESKEYLNEAQFKQGLMEYTSEKNRYSNMLLGVYAFLNISALAIIFHLYK
jgi:hypothetical protein